MKFNKLQQTVLSVAGLTALLIGIFIAFDPIAFYSSYGLALEGNADMLSELRAPGMNLAVLGSIMLAGVSRSSLRPLAIAASLVVFSSFAAGRVLGILVDGLPSEKVLGALLIELVVAVLCFAAFLGKRRAVSNEQPYDTKALS